MSSLPFLPDAYRTPHHVFPICFFLRFWKQAELNINTPRVHYTLENRFHQSGSSFILRLPILLVKELKTRGGERAGRSITRDGSVTDLNMKAPFHSADKLPDPRVGMISGLTLNKRQLVDLLNELRALFFISLNCVLWIHKCPFEKTILTFCLLFFPLQSLSQRYQRQISSAVRGEKENTDWSVV